MNETILKATQDLGSLLRDSAEFDAMQKQEEIALADSDLQGLYREYSLLRQNMQQEETESEPDHGAIEALTLEIGRLEQTLSQNDSLAVLNKSREGFNRLMQEVNDVLENTLNPKQESDEFEDGGCGSGGCAGCSGCGSSR